MLQLCLHQTGTIIVQAHGHGNIPFNNHARAAKLASEHAANQERQMSRQQRSSHHHHQSKPIRKKKSIEEGIQNAKKFKKVVLEEEVVVDSDNDDSGDSGNDVMLPPDVSEEEQEDGDEDDSLWGITSGFEQEADEVGNDGDGHARRRKKKRRRRRKRKTRYVEEDDTDNDRPSASPSMAPTAMPTTTTSEGKVISSLDESATMTDTPTTTPSSSSLVGKTLLDKFYIANQVRIGSTKSELYQCYPVSDLGNRSHPLMMKLSQSVSQMQLEYKIYNELYSKLTEPQKDLFIKVFDWIPADALILEDDDEEEVLERVGFVMEAGLENLRGIVWRHGPMKGDTLKQAMWSIISTIHALHRLNTVWTEVKAENFVVMPNGNIKAIDLESLAAHGEFLRCYSAETYPPEFPPDSLYNEIPKVPLEYSFDIWGLGLILLEMAIGEPLFTLQRTYDVDYVRERLKDPQGIVDQAIQRLQDCKVDPQAQNVILQCLVVDPAQRSTCGQLLKHGYFRK